MTIETRLNSLVALLLEEANRNRAFSDRLEYALTGQMNIGQEMKGVTEDCIKFNDEDQRVGVNLVPIDSVRTIPRVGEWVDLPGDMGAGAGIYKVAKVTHCYREDPGGERPGSAKPLSITVNLRSVGHRTHRRAPALFDPFAAYAQSEHMLRQRLNGLHIEQLKDMVAEHGMDSSKLAMKWKAPGRLVELIVGTVRERSRKGDAFRSR